MANRNKKNKSIEERNPVWISLSFQNLKRRVKSTLKVYLNFLQCNLSSKRMNVPILTSLLFDYLPIEYCLQMINEEFWITSWLVKSCLINITWSITHVIFSCRSFFFIAITNLQWLYFSPDEDKLLLHCAQTKRHQMLFVFGDPAERRSLLLCEFTVSGCAGYLLGGLFSEKPARTLPAVHELNLLPHASVQGGASLLRQ